MKHLFVFYLSLILCLVLSCRKEDSCEGCSTNNNLQNHPPVACAGQDQSITLPVNSVLLDGSCSTDPDNDFVSYSWKKISGPASSSIVNGNRAQTQVNMLVEGTYFFQLIIKDAGGLFTMDTVQVIVNNQINNSNVDIYIAGENEGRAAYWKNGELILLSASASNSTASAITVEGNDVYVAGEEGGDFFDYVNKAKYWKNGQEVFLTGGATGALTTSIAVVGGDVYVTGSESSGSNYVAKYWKNNQSFSLTNGSGYAEATGIAIIDGNVYISGHENGVAKYWVNGQPVTLTDGSHQAYANSIAVVGSDVYVAGWEDNKDGPVAKYWKNGQGVSLIQGTTGWATAIKVVGPDVYIAGWEGDLTGLGGNRSVAKYWKNGEAVLLTNGTTYAYATSIAVFDNDIYVAGYEGNDIAKSIYWKNGQSQMLGGNGNIANCIVVVPR